MWFVFVFGVRAWMIRGKKGGGGRSGTRLRALAVGGEAPVVSRVCEVLLGSGA